MSNRYNYISSYPYGPIDSFQPISNSRWSCTASGVCVENNYSGEYTNLRSCINACSGNGGCSTCYNPYINYYPQPFQPYPIYPNFVSIYQPFPVYSYYPQSLLYFNNNNYRHNNQAHRNNNHGHHSKR